MKMGQEIVVGLLHTSGKNHARAVLLGNRAAPSGGLHSSLHGDVDSRNLLVLKTQAIQTPEWWNW